jgi:type II secretory pathway predicted ATPase ExeA
MYNGCFGLNRRPFVAVPQVDYYFPAGTMETARTTLARCIQRGEGAGWVVGPSGTGKTLLCLMLAEQFRRSFHVAMLASGRLSSRRALMQAILYELGRPYRGMDEGELRLSIVDYLTVGDGAPRGMVLLVDEAHTLPLRLLDEIRLLGNLSRNGQPAVRLVLAGAPALEERFASPKLDSFSQRLTARCYLEAFNRTETENYIQTQISAAGGCGEEMFPEPACQNVFQATGGVPRLINQVCDHALLLAHAAGEKVVQPARIEEAWADLQQLPTPWNGEAETGGPPSSVIEFGSLDDAPTTNDAPPDVPMPTTAAVFKMNSLETGSENDAAVEDAGPVGQIQRIERLLSEADNDFQPCGKTGPEIELCFEEADHPFQEEFQHEEVVADRYGAATASTWGRTAVAPQAVPRACSAEGPSANWQPCQPSWVTSESTLVENEQNVTLVSPVAPVQTVLPKTPKNGRANEFRQLFARLRRG